MAHGTPVLHRGTGPVNLVFLVLGASACSSRSRPQLYKITTAKLQLDGIFN